MRKFSEAQDALFKASEIMKNDGYCRSRLIFSYLHQNKFDKAMVLWNSAISDLKKQGVPDELIDCYTAYIQLYEKLDNSSNIESILAWKGAAENEFIGVALKLYVRIFAKKEFPGEKRYEIGSTAECQKLESFVAKDSELADKATRSERMIAALFILFAQMCGSDHMEDYEMQGMCMWLHGCLPCFEVLLKLLTLQSLVLSMTSPLNKRFAAGTGIFNIYSSAI